MLIPLTSLGNTLSRAHTEDLTMQVTQAPGRNADSKDQEFNPPPEVQEVDQQGGRNHDFVDVGASSASIIARTTSLVGKMVQRNGTRPRVAGRPLLSKPKFPGSFRFNASRIMPGGRIFVPGSVHKNPKVAEKEEETEIKNLQPYVLTIRDSGKDQSEAASTSGKIDDISPTVMPGSDSETNRQRGSEEPSSAIGSKRQPDVGIALPGNDTNLVSLNTTGTIQGQEKKCLNKIKVTHFRLPLKERVNRYRGNGKGLEGNTTGSDPNETPPHGGTDLDYTPDPLHKIITDTFDNLNITKISVHLFKPLNFSADADTVRMHILKGLGSVSGSTSESSSNDASEPPSLLKRLISSSPASSPSPSVSSPLSLSFLSSSSNEFDSSGSNKLFSSTNSPLPVDSKLSHSGASKTPLFHQTPPKRGSMHRVYQNFQLLPNKTRQNVSISQNLSSQLNHTSKQDTDVDLPVKNMSRDKDAKFTSESSRVEQGPKRTLRERVKIPVRRPLLKGSYPRQPTVNVQNQTRTNLKDFTQPSQLSNPKTHTDTHTDTQIKQVFSTNLPASSSPVFDAVTLSELNNNTGTNKRSTTSSSNGLDPTTRRRGVPVFRRPNFRQPQLHGESFQNKTFTSLRRHYPYRGFTRKSFPTRKQDNGSLTTGDQTNHLGIDNTPESPEIQSQHQNVGRFFHSFPINKSKDQENYQLSHVALTDVHETTASKERKELGKVDSTLTDVDATRDFTSHKERLDPGRNAGVANRNTPSFQLNFRPTKPETVPNRQPPSRTSIETHRNIHSISDGQNKAHLETNHTVKRILDTETDQATGTESDGSSSVMREPLDFVGVTNRTSHGYALVWESPEGKYNNFLVSRTEAKQEEDPQQKESTQKEYIDQMIREVTSENIGQDDDNRLSETFVSQVPSTQDGIVAKSSSSNKTFKKVLPGSARSLQFEHLPPQRDYTLTLLGRGPGLLSKLHKLVISTGTQNGDCRRT